MYTGKRLTVGQRWDVVEAYAKGERTADLAKKYEVSRWTIYRLLRRYQETGNVDLEFGRCGRKSKLTKFQQDAIRAALEANPHTNMQELHDRLRLPCTMRGLYYIAKKMGFERPTFKMSEPPKQENDKPLPVWRGLAYWRR
ncbi:MAG: helix-turn-helix domain containing protein [Schwartzia sp.]|nr:helix-turn-helix domain containing protein [Schwartzia sp. (in: firmicutes)]MBR1761611.1 helix-turn-helix domain containing protein [Schwartzia sp. (in: firmicutes)]